MRLATKNNLILKEDALAVIKATSVMVGID